MKGGVEVWRESGKDLDSHFIILDSQQSIISWI